eukprot:16240_1
MRKAVEYILVLTIYIIKYTFSVNYFVGMNSFSRYGVILALWLIINHVIYLNQIHLFYCINSRKNLKRFRKLSNSNGHIYSHQRDIWKIMMYHMQHLQYLQMVYSLLKKHGKIRKIGTTETKTIMNGQI